MIEAMEAKRPVKGPTDGPVALPHRDRFTVSISIFILLPPAPRGLPATSEALPAASDIVLASYEALSVTTRLNKKSALVFTHT